MSRHAATVSAPARVWDDIETAVRELSRLFTSSSSEVVLSDIAREHHRIAQSSRHWLMG